MNGMTIWPIEVSATMVILSLLGIIILVKSSRKPLRFQLMDLFTPYQSIYSISELAQIIKDYAEKKRQGKVSKD